MVGPLTEMGNTGKESGSLEITMHLVLECWAQGAFENSKKKYKGNKYMKAGKVNLHEAI